MDVPVPAGINPGSVVPPGSTIINPAHLGNNSNALPTAAIAIGCVFGAALLLLIAFFAYRRRVHLQKLANSFISHQYEAKMPPSQKENDAGLTEAFHIATGLNLATVKQSAISADPQLAPLKPAASARMDNKESSGIHDSFHPPDHRFSQSLKIARGNHAPFAGHSHFRSSAYFAHEGRTSLAPSDSISVVIMKMEGKHALSPELPLTAPPPSSSSLFRRHSSTARRAIVNSSPPSSVHITRVDSFHTIPPAISKAALRD